MVQPKLKTQVLGILDAAVEGSLAGVPIGPPQAFDLKDSVDAIVVTIGDWDTFLFCKDELGKFCQAPVYWMLDLYEFHVHFPTSNDIESLLPSPSESDLVQSLFDDEKSRQVLFEAISSHKDRSFVARQCESLESQYLIPELALEANIGHVVHCGAHNGSTLRHFARNFRSISQLSCFEPTHSFHAALKQRAIEFSLFASTAFHQVAVGERFSFVVLEQFGDASTNNRAHPSHMKMPDPQFADNSVLMVALDELYEDRAVDFITMDIEGGELSALLGAQSVMFKQRPRLAISVYHSPEDVWNIPLFLNALTMGGYRMFLRRHTPFNAETVLYCVPR